MVGVIERCIGCGAGGLIRWNLRRGGEESGVDESKLRWSTVVDALESSPKLLGKYLRKDDVVLQITEVEAYRSNDSACHGRVGVTSRTAPLFGPGGHAYVYLCYGLHTMLNVVADKEGIGSAVLIRACAPVTEIIVAVHKVTVYVIVEGLETIKQRRGLDTEKPVLLTGPGKIGQALGISRDWTNHALFSPGGLELLDGPEVKEMLVGPRVGIDYALPEDVSALWRFAIAAEFGEKNKETTLEYFIYQSRVLKENKDSTGLSTFLRVNCVLKLELERNENVYRVPEPCQLRSVGMMEDSSIKPLDQNFRKDEPHGSWLSGC
ncbi:DNA-3-methyladenine glycosylase [Tanacetum coccineum]